MRAPRAVARSHSSRTTRPQPSLSTKPSRLRVNGRDALLGSSLRVDSARIDANPPMHSGETVASVPPAIITSAPPRAIRWNASPMLCAPVEQADTWLMFGPR